ncbi:hypothetical protein K3G39_00390 [Pontibacter sp. HSC-14F20]|uniref:DUF2231 domain-containing protein n=1 Tax=Pontibacter sp. HSC-14F20 TaxID=2864136 RepID=UPI001C736CCD|nr:DUF2231 domain-containing protein [Pontibacter sp. HSC-14F20]MBX0331686.1 hypothetical protein [Pontibacter sp. HSC-14F20]
MEELLSWRTEAWHPLTVHFPVALLLFGTLAKLLALLLRPEQAAFWHRMGAYLLYAGTAGAWLSIYTGDLADGIVSRKLCDPTVLKAHELASYNVAYLFTGAMVLDLSSILSWAKRYGRLLTVVVVLLMLAGSGFLAYTGHLGAKLVYEQAGGVQVPPADCAGF